MMSTIYRMLMALMVAALMVACATTFDDEDVTDEPRPIDEDVTRVDVIGDDPAFDALPMDDEFRRELTSEERDFLAERIVYFAFDSSTISSEDEAVVRAHARYLSYHPNSRVVLEGHTDERGSREYNIGLGERRAQSVRRMLLAQGVSSGQIETVSFGEEQPADMRSNEEAWRLNRRVEFVYGE